MWWIDANPRQIVPQRRRTAPAPVVRVEQRHQASGPVPASPRSTPQTIGQLPGWLGSLGPDPLPESWIELNRILEFAASGDAAIGDLASEGPHAKVQSERAATKRLSREAIRLIASQRRTLKSDLAQLESALKQKVESGWQVATENQHRRVVLQDCLARESYLRTEIAGLKRIIDRQAIDRVESNPDESTLVDDAIESVERDWAFADSISQEEKRKLEESTKRLSDRLKTLAEQLTDVRQERTQLLRLVRDERTRRRRDREALACKHQRDHQRFETKLAEQISATSQAKIETDIASRHVEILFAEINQLHSQVYSTDQINAAFSAQLNQSDRRYWHSIEQIAKASRRARATRCTQHTSDISNVGRVPSVETAPSLESAVESHEANHLHWQTMEKIAQSARRTRMARCMATVPPAVELSEPVLPNPLPDQDGDIAERNHELDHITAVDPVDFDPVDFDPAEFDPADFEPAKLEPDQRSNEEATLTANQWAIQQESHRKQVEELEGKIISSVDAATKLRIDLNHRMSELQVMQTEQGILRDRLQRRNRQLARRHDRERLWMEQHGEQISDLTQRIETLYCEMETAGQDHREEVSRAETENERHRETVLKQDSELVRFQQHVEMLRDLIRQGRANAAKKIAQYQKEISAYEEQFQRLREKSRRAA